MTDRRCKICDRLIPVKRRRRHPGAVLCGSDSCDVVNQRRRHNRNQQTYRQSRGERDPQWRASELARDAVRYQRRRMRAVSATNGGTKASGREAGRSGKGGLNHE